MSNFLVRDGASLPDAGPVPADVEPVRPAAAQVAGTADALAELHRRSDVDDAGARLSAAADHAQRALEAAQRGEISIEVAQARILTSIIAMAEPLGTMVTARRGAAAQRARAQRRHGWGADAVLGSDDAGQPRELEVWLPSVLASLDRVAHSVFLLQRLETAQGGRFTRSARAAAGLHTPGAAGGDAKALLAPLAAASVTLGWTAPPDLAEAEARVVARVACGPDSYRDRPEQCSMLDEERARQQNDTMWALHEMVERFAAVCAKHQAALDAAIARTRATRGLVLGIVKDAVKTGLGAATAGTGEVIGFALDVGYALGDAQLETDEPVRESASVALLSALQEALAGRAVELRQHLAELDDHQLRILRHELAARDAAYFEARLAPLLASYREQIEPIGLIGGATRDLTHGARYQAVWAIRGGRRQLALVVGETYAPLHVSPERPAARHAYRFERWIDPQFATVVGAQAPEVPAETIEQLPLGWFLQVDP